MRWFRYAFWPYRPKKYDVGVHYALWTILGVSKNEVAASCSWETWARRAKAGVGRCRAKVLPPRIRGTTNRREILSSLSFFFLPDDCAELVRSTPNGKNRAGWIKFRPGVSWAWPVWRADPMCCTIDGEMQAYPSAPLFEHSQKRRRRRPHFIKTQYKESDQ